MQTSANCLLSLLRVIRQTQSSVTARARVRARVRARALAARLKVVKEWRTPQRAECLVRKRRGSQCLHSGCGQLNDGFTVRAGHT